MIKLACFDLDDTLTQEIHSVMLLCMLNDKLDELIQIEKLEHNGRLHWIEADYHKASLIKGLSVDCLSDGFTSIVKPLNNIRSTIALLKQRGIQCIVITAGPKQVAAAAGELWGFDAAYGSDYEVKDGVFTGRIIRHLGDIGKISCLLEHCQNNGFSLGDCIAVGDGSTDIPLFEHCSKSIAINASPAAKLKATYNLETSDLYDILQYF